MLLTLEHPTIKIHVYVIEEDRETFFYGYPGSEKLRRKLNRLLKII